MRNQIANFTYIMRRVMIEQAIGDVTSIDANDLRSGFMSARWARA